MAKTILPLLSGEASGKIAKAMVFFNWKGYNVVRKWTIPANPRADLQKEARTKLAATGKNIVAMSTRPAVEGAIVGLIKAVTPANVVWNAHFVGNVLNRIKDPAVFTTIIDEYTGHTYKDVFDDAAAALALVDIATGVQYAMAVPAGLQLYLGAYGAFGLGLDGRADYSIHPTAWVTATIEALAEDYTSA